MDWEKNKMITEMLDNLLEIAKNDEYSIYDETQRSEKLSE